MGEFGIDSAVKLVLLKLHTVTMLMLPMMTILLSVILPSMEFPGQLRADTEEVDKSFEEYLKLCNTLGIQPISTDGGYTSYTGYPSYTGGYVYPSNTGSYVYPSNT